MILGAQQASQANMMGKLSLYFVNVIDRERKEQIRIAEEAVRATLKAE